MQHVNAPNVDETVHSDHATLDPTCIVPWQGGTAGADEAIGAIDEGAIPASFGDTASADGPRVGSDGCVLEFRVRVAPFEGIRANVDRR